MESVEKDPPLVDLLERAAPCRWTVTIKSPPHQVLPSPLSTRKVRKVKGFLASADRQCRDYQLRIFLSTRQSTNCVQYGYACSELVHIKIIEIAMNLTPLNY